MPAPRSDAGNRAVRRARHADRLAMSWFWCLDHKRVEEGLGCGSTTRLGPYATPSQAATALARTRERERQQEQRDQEDERFWGRKPTWL